MEDCTKKKRVRDESAANTPKSKNHRVGSNSEVSSFDSEVTRVESVLNSSESQLSQVDSDESLPNANDAAIDSAGASGMQDDLLNFLDEDYPDNVPERDSAMQGLDTVIKSFEEEILAPGPDLVDPTLGSESRELHFNLGYLLEASDDELGLPPTVTTNEEKGASEPTGRVGAEGLDLVRWGFEDDIPNYDSLGFGNGILVNCDAVDDGGFVTMDGLFDYAESTDILWPSESLQAM